MTQPFKSKRLLLLAPHLKVFIRDQAELVGSAFGSGAVLIPIPWFAKIALSLPYIRRRFDFIRQTVDSKESVDSCVVLKTRFFTLPIETMRRRNYSLIARGCVRKLAQNHLNFDLIHAHFLELGFAGAALKDERGIPLIVTAHGSDVYDLPFRDKWRREVARYVLSKADQVITVSQFNAARLSSLGVSPRKLCVIYNGYDARIFRPISKQAARSRLALPLTKKILLSVGNLVDAKGHEYLIDAMSVLLKKRHDVVLFVVGSGPLEAKLLHKIRRLRLDHAALLVGAKQHEEIPMWMNASDISVLPSLSEGFPTVIPESLACGKPVVGTKVGGVPEALSDRDVGILVSPKDSMALADAIAAALEKKWRADTIANYAQQYSWTNLVEQILEVYQSCGISESA